MSREEIIRIAASVYGSQFTEQDLCFAALVALAVREVCANVALNEPRVWNKDAQDPQHRIAAAILAGGQQ